MRVRAGSSVWVVLVGIVPAVLGGPVFAAAIALICGIGFQEFRAMTVHLGSRRPAVG